MLTLGADFAIKRLSNSALQIWDLAGQEIYSRVRDGYYNGAQGVILVYDVSNISSFENLPNWLVEVTQKTKERIPIVLVGNKVDLRDANTVTNDDLNYVTTEQGQQYSEMLSEWSGFNVPFIESSALTGENIEGIFNQMVNEIDIYLETKENS